MLFRRNETATATTATTAKRTKRVRMAVMGGALAVLPVAGLVIRAAAVWR